MSLEEMNIVACLSHSLPGRRTLSVKSFLFPAGERSSSGISPGSSSAYEDAYGIGQQALESAPGSYGSRRAGEYFGDSSFYTQSQSTDHSGPLCVYPTVSFMIIIFEFTIVVKPCTFFS